MPVSSRLPITLGGRDDRRSTQPLLDKRVDERVQLEVVDPPVLTRAQLMSISFKRVGNQQTLCTEHGADWEADIRRSL